MAMYTACGSYYGGILYEPAPPPPPEWAGPQYHRDRAQYQRRQSENGYRLYRAKEKAGRRGLARLKGRHKNNRKRYQGR